MSYFKHTDDVTVKSILPGFNARMVHTDELTIAHISIEAGSLLPEHQHLHEQVTNILEGTLRMTVDGETMDCTAGTVVTIPGDTPHSARALTDCTVIDIFRPVREDYK